MSRSERMSKVVVLGPKSYKKKVIEALYDLNLYHLVDHEKDDVLDIGSPLEESERLSNILVKARSLISQLNLKKDVSAPAYESKIMTDDDISSTESLVLEIAKKVSDSSDKIKQDNSALVAAKNNLKIIEPLSRFDVDFKVLSKSDVIDYVFGFNTKKAVDKNILNNVTKEFELVNKEHDNSFWTFLICRKDKKPLILEAMKKDGFSEVDIENLKDESGDILPREDAKQLIKDLEMSISKEKNKIDHIISKQGEFLLKTEMILEDELKKAQSPLRFGETKSSFLIKGWIPSKDEKAFTDTINNVSKNKVDIQINGATKKDKKVPIKLKNNKLWKPFEFFLKLYALPKYNELDPSLFMFFTFPLFFGMMLGDVVYGLITLLLWIFLMKKMPSAKGLLKVMMWASVMSIIFGGIYGEYLGFEYISEEHGEALCNNVGICFAKETLHHGEEEHVEEHVDTGSVQHEAEEIDKAIEEIVHESDQAGSSVEETHEVPEEESSSEVSLSMLAGFAVPVVQPAVLVDKGIEDDGIIDIHSVLLADGVDLGDSEVESETKIVEEEVAAADVPEEHAGSEVSEVGAEQDVVEEEEEEVHEEAAHEEAHEEAEVVYSFPRLISRLHHTTNVGGNQLLTVLVIGLIVGAIHINLSLIIGFFNAFAAHGFVEAFLEKISWMIFEFAVVALALKLFPVYVSVIIMVISIVMIYKGDGVQGLIELPAIFSNMASYMRIGAVGLASVGLAMVVNEKLGVPFIQKGGVFIVVGILIMVIGHAINIALGIIGPFLHSTRLHYVEFFSRFFKGGGVEYEPFGSKNKDMDLEK